MQEKIDIIIYESSSFGGCYNYAVQLLGAYKKKTGVNCRLVVPKNAPYRGGEVKKILISDKICTKNRIIKKLTFLYRSFMNPFILLSYLLRQKPSVVLMNDFEQLSAPFWNIFYQILLKKHLLSIFLHDPNRDNYPPSYIFARYSMKSVMKPMQIAFYHEILPEKPYYKNLKTSFVEVPHGLYPENRPDEYLLNKLMGQKKNIGYLLAIIGNIREEKNYRLIIRALAELPNCGLVIAGKPASSEINTEAYKKLAKKMGVNEKIIWIERYVSDQEMASVIKASDCISLYYSSTFASQSAILNEIANYKKEVIISDTNSSLTQIAKKFNLGRLIKADNKASFVMAVKELVAQKENSNWEAYKNYASWDRNATIALESYKKILNE